MKIRNMVLASALLLAMGQAQAVTITWSPEDTLCSKSTITPAAEHCQWGINLESNNTNDTAALVAGRFGITNWTSLENLKFDPVNQQEGSYNFLSTYEHMMLVFKNGENTGLYTYLVTDPDGTWTSPFPINGTLPKGVSHISYYVSGGTTTVPEPGSLALMGLGLLGLGFTARRKTN